VSQTKYCFSLKVKWFVLPKNVGMATPLHLCAVRGYWIEKVSKLRS